MLAVGWAVVVSVAAGAELRLGIIGCDTSHVVAFTETLNNPNAKGHLPGARVVAAFKGGSKDIPASWSRVEQFSLTLKEKYGVEFYDSIEEMCRHVDAVLLESVDGRRHLEQARPVLEARKPLFIDKPMAGSLKEATEIFRLAKAVNVPVFSSSALRFATNGPMAGRDSLGRIVSVEAYGPCTLEPHHPDLFWYGVHGIESLYTVLGADCQTVQRGATPEGKLEVVGTWSGGRKGIFREDKKFHQVIKGERGEISAASFDGYAPLLAEIVKFFQTGVAPVKPEETLEILAFMEAADESKRNGGKPVTIGGILRKNRS